VCNRAWLQGRLGRLFATIEPGAGLAFPTGRRQSEALGKPLIRINPREPEAPGGISLRRGAREALERTDALLDAPAAE
jgi:hypothetical protein